MSRKPKNRSSKDKRVARTVQQRRARARAEGNVLYSLRPPFSGYQDWIRVSPDGEHDAQMLELGEIYDGLVPPAAIELDNQIRRGTLWMYDPDDPAGHEEVPFDAFMQLVLGTDLHMLQLAHPDRDVLQDARTLMHDWHLVGAVLVGDDNCIRPVNGRPDTSAGRWIVFGGKSSSQ